jgi:amidase
MRREAKKIFLALFIFLQPSLLLAQETFILEEATIASLHDAIKGHKTTCEQLIKAYFQRIQQYNFTIKQTAPINAFTQLNPYLFDEARRLDHVYAKTNKLQGSLHCVPIVLKDNIDTFDMTSTSGSYALLGTQPINDAFLVKQLRKAGAIIIAKGGMDELASGMIGISSRSGRIGNAYDPSKNPGGSSGGPAAAVSANFAMIGIGTDNSGSVRIPAAFNGIYGLRPSMGLISQSGIFPAGNIDGTAGPLTRNVRDLALLLDVIAKPDTHDVKTYTDSLNENGLQGKRIGIVRQVGKIDTFATMPDDVNDVINQALHLMQAWGATIVDNIDLPAFDNERKYNMAGMREDVDAYLHSFPATRKDFKDLCESDRSRVYGTVKACLRFIASLPKKLGQEQTKARATLAKNSLYLTNIMTDNKLDALLVPISVTGSATYDPNKVNTWQAPLASNSGHPALAMNIGYTESDNMPIGIELVGKHLAETTLLEIAYGYEQHTPPRMLPKLAETDQPLTGFSLPYMNNLITLLGSQAYEQVLKKDKTTALTPPVFKKIVVRELASS